MCEIPRNEQQYKTTPTKTNRIDLLRTHGIRDRNDDNDDIHIFIFHSKLKRKEKTSIPILLIGQTY